MHKIKIGYVGCGFMAQKVHIPNLMAMADCELVALAEVRQELGRKVQAGFGIPKLYRHHTELAKDREVEAVAVSAAFHVQGAIARDLLLAGKAVFMEKPMAISVAQAQEILAAEQGTGARLMVGYMKRYDAGNELFKETLDGFRASGELGEIVYARNHGFCGNWTAGNDAPVIRTDEPHPHHRRSHPRLAARGALSGLCELFAAVHAQRQPVALAPGRRRPCPCSPRGPERRRLHRHRDPGHEGDTSRA